MNSCWDHICCFDILSMNYRKKKIRLPCICGQRTYFFYGYPITCSSNETWQDFLPILISTSLDHVSLIGTKQCNCYFFAKIRRFRDSPVPVSEFMSPSLFSDRSNYLFFGFIFFLPTKFTLFSYHTIESENPEFSVCKMV